MTERELLELKKKVDEAKSTVSELTGHKQALMKQLKDDWNCKSAEEAQKKLKSMNKEIEDIESQIEEGVKELEEKYNIE